MSFRLTIIYTIISSMFISCQNKTDLKTLNFGREISVKIKGFEKDFSTNIPLKGIYRTEEIDNFHFGKILLKSDSIQFKGESLKPKNELILVVDSYDTNKYVGFELTLINEEISNQFLEYFNEAYSLPLRKYENIKTDYKDQIYLWNSDKDHLFVKYNKHNDIHQNIETGENQILSKTVITLLQHGLTFEYDERNYFYKSQDKEKVEAHFRENPKDKLLFQIFKNQLPESSD